MCQSKVWEPRQRVRDGTVLELCQGYVHRGREEHPARMGAPVRLSLQMGNALQQSGNARDAVMDRHSLGPIPKVREGEEQGGVTPGRAGLLAAGALLVIGAGERVAEPLLHQARQPLHAVHDLPLHPCGRDGH